MPYYRRNLIVLSVTIFLAALSWQQVVPFLPLFMREMGVEHNLLRWVGIVFAAQSVASIVTLPFWGKLGDRFGQKAMVIRAGVCLSAIYFGTSIASSPWELTLYRFLNGALTGFIPSSFALIATNTPQERAPRAVATAQTASAVGVIIGPAVGGLLAALLGYRGSLRVSGLAVAIATLLVWLLVQAPNKPRDVEETSLAQDFATALGSPIVSSVMLISLLGSMFHGAIQPILVLHLGKMNHGAPDWLTGVVYALPAGAFVLTARRWTQFGERWGFDRSVVVGLTVAAAFAVSLTFARSVWLFGPLFFMTGLFMAALSPSAAGITCTRVKGTFQGRAYGMQQSASFTGALLAPLAATQVAAVLGMPAVFVFAGAVLLIGAMGFRRLVRKWG